MFGRARLPQSRDLRFRDNVSRNGGHACTAAAPNIKHLFPPGAQRGSKVEIKATGDFSTWPIKTWTSDPGLSVECKDDKGKLQVTVSADTKPGVYLVRAYNDEGASRPVPFIVGNLAEVIEKSENDSPHQGESLPAVVTVNGRLEKRDDVDVYAVELEQGQTVVASMLANEVLASPMDAVLQMLNADGIVLAQNPRLAWTRPTDCFPCAQVPESTWSAYLPFPRSRIAASGLPAATITFIA